MSPNILGQYTVRGSALRELGKGELEKNAQRKGYVLNAADRWIFRRLRMGIKKTRNIAQNVKNIIIHDI
ncbi:hypothetical protein M5W75_04415 [Paenibacillus larvae]|uniref:hypothetical protein n=1 Tax=Paenibacillus larvae TaxID=1464 RepID=UPI002280595A|nr:hypothetical protein [Paenibacillus larvae]MCY9749114.1 hypothetical protein [Paenibacillus larvae]MEC0187842.1 hypothetical protein [Paenibacillus larvae]